MLSLNQNALHYITIATIDWIDIFTRRVYKNIIVDSLSYCRKEKGLELYGYVIMTNHIHLICRANENFELSDIIRDFKRHTAKYVLKELQENPHESRREWILEKLQNAGEKNQKNKTYQLWRQDNHPIELFNAEIFKEKLDYIHNNPVVEGFVERPEDFLYSSARNYTGLLAVIQVDLI